MGKVAVGVAVVCAATACAVAALVVRHRMKSSGRWARAVAILKELEEKCAAPVAKLRQVADAMTVEMHAGLASEGGSKLKMIISYVDNLPTGYKGTILREHNATSLLLIIPFLFARRGISRYPRSLIRRAHILSFDFLL